MKTNVIILAALAVKLSAAAPDGESDTPIFC